MSLAWEKAGIWPYQETECGRYAINYARTSETAGAFTAVRKKIGGSVILAVVRDVPVADEDARKAARFEVKRACEEDATRS